MKIPIYQIDAFSGRRFGGNPAAVCPLDDWLDDRTLQAIAAENNLSETAFFTEAGGRYKLRWFTPTREVDLCGHATLATAFVLFEEIGVGGDKVAFETPSGPLAVSRDGDRLTLDFPARPPAPIDVDTATAIAEALGGRPAAVLGNVMGLAVFESEADVRALKPDFERVAVLALDGVIVTAPGTAVDFVSRYFAPAAGIPEDPVTGSAHCLLTPYWAERLSKTQLTARQVSARGGELWCEARGERVAISGRAVKFLEGLITL